MNCQARRRRNDDGMCRQSAMHRVIVTAAPRPAVHRCSHAAAVINDPHYPAGRLAPGHENLDPTRGMCRQGDGRRAVPHQQSPQPSLADVK